MFFIKSHFNKQSLCQMFAGKINDQNCFLQKTAYDAFGQVKSLFKFLYDHLHLYVAAYM